MKTAIILSLLGLFFGVNTNAQNTIEGRVTDRETHQPLEAATVTLQQGTEGVVINYTLTDDDGRFRLAASSQIDMKISVLYLGYKKEFFPALFSKPMNIELVQDAILLKEVQIRPGRVWGRQDTLKYDLTRFASSKDRNVSDVLKKLPGINVEENGTIKYNGKTISNLYVEGMDVSGGRYNQINNNLKADAVQVAEVIEGHQPIKSLRGKTFTEDVALNLKLKPEVRSRWIYTMAAGTGYGDEALYDASVNALQLSREQQTVYTYKANNTGRDMLSEQKELATGNSFDRVADDGALSFLPLPELAMPLSQKRLLFNETHTAVANRLYRLDEDRQLRFRLGYVHDHTVQQQGSDETYYFAQDTIRTVYNQGYRLKTDCLNGELNYENNTATRYTRENLVFTGAWKDGFSSVSGDEMLFQRVKHTQLEVKNYFSQLYTRDKYTWGIRSFIRYSHLPQSLNICRVNSQRPTEIEKMNIHNVYTDNSLYWMRKKNRVNYQVTTGFRGELSSVNYNGSYFANRYQVYAIPRIEWERNDFQLTASATTQWNCLPEHSYHQFYLAPSLYLRYKFTPRWKISLSGSLNQMQGGMEDLYPMEYREDYRTTVQHPGIVSESTRQLYSFYLEYKNAIKEFFWIASLTYTHTARNLMTERNYEEGIFHLSSFVHRNFFRGYTLNSLLSKGVYDWNLKASLEMILSRNEGKQLNEGTVQNYRYDYLRAEPKLIWAPSPLFEAEYKVAVTCSTSRIGADTRLEPLWNVSQSLTLNMGWHDTDLQLSGEHFYNDLGNAQHLNTWLADVSLIHKTGKWRFSASVINIFDKIKYSYTLYSAIQSYTSWVKLRPREFLLSAQYQW
ncbi:carboxypeptidase-like regulatory domain-containing protein [Phocaeicola sp.]